MFGENYYNYIDSNIVSRQTGERFQATLQSKRVLCTGEGNCVLRISRATQFRSVSFERAQSYVQSEQYLADDDIDIIRIYRYYSYFK